MLLWCFIPQTDNKHNTGHFERSTCHAGKSHTGKPGDYSGSTGKSGGLPTIRFKAAFDANGIYLYHYEQQTRYKANLAYYMALHT